MRNEFCEYKDFVVRYAHLAHRREGLTACSRLRSGDVIGTMGGTPLADDGSFVYPVHLHIDCREAMRDYKVDIHQNWRLSNTPMMYTITQDSKAQLDIFVNDGGLFGTDMPVVKTTDYMCEDYLAKYNRPHPAYDVVPQNRFVTQENFTIYWNRSDCVGKVIGHGSDVMPSGYGYGNYLIISFCAQVPGLA